MKPNVIALEFAKEGVLAAPYKEGQYLFLLCPYLSKIQWHPFTISSAPQVRHCRRCIMHGSSLFALLTECSLCRNCRRNP